jgi:hypothetical protein
VLADARRARDRQVRGEPLQQRVDLRFMMLELVLGTDQRVRRAEHAVRRERVRAGVGDGEAEVHDRSCVT